MTVLFVVFQKGTRANGAVESITQVIEHLEGVRSIVLTQAETPVNDRWREAGARVVVWPWISWPSGSVPEPRRRGLSRVRRLVTRLGSMVRANLEIYRLVRSSGTRVVHVNGTMGELYHSLAGSLAAGASVLHNVRSLNEEGRPYRWTWLALGACSRILALSREMSESLTDRLPRPFWSVRGGPPIEYIYSIVPPDLPASAPVDRPRIRVELGIPQDTFAVGFVGSINPLKEQLRFIEEAGPPLKEACPRMRVYLVGDYHPRETGYMQRCREAVDRLELHGLIAFQGYSANVGSWYKASDVTLLASRREGLSRAMIESVACGTPVVSFDVCSAREILLDHDCGRVVPQGDYGALAKELVELSRAPDELRRLGENARQTGDRLFRPEVIVPRFEQLYLELVLNSEADESRVRVS